MRCSTLAFLLLLEMVAGCSDKDRPTFPTPPTAAPSPPSGIAAIRGLVADTAMRALAGARVEVIDGAATGTSAVVGADGFLLMIGGFDGTSRLRATAAGHEDVVLTASCFGNPCSAGATAWINFYLRPLSPPAIDLSGDYTMTMMANESCATLPEEARSRAYRVTLSPRLRLGTADVMGFIVSHQSGAVVEALRQGYIGVAGNYARSYLIGGEGEQPGLIEWLDDTGYVAFMGTAAAALTPGAASFTLSFNGQVEYLQLRAPIPSNGIISGIETRLTCTSSEHRMVLTR